MKKYTESTEDIAQQFLAEMGQQELWPTMYNCAPLVQATAWTGKEYYGKWYDEASPFPLFVDIKDGVGVMYIPLTYAKNIAEEVYTKFANNPATLKDREVNCISYEATIRQAYDTCSDSFFDSASLDDRRKELERLRDTSWSYNALVFFSTGFDKDAARTVSERLSLTLDEGVWKRASMLSAPSFEMRHGWQVADLFKQNADVSLGEACQYFFAGYDGVPTVEYSDQRVRTGYALYMSPGGYTRAKQERAEFERTQAEHDAWIASLTGSDASLAHFAEEVIRMRDGRKDFLLMFVTVAYRAARAMLRGAHMDESLAPYLLFDELMLDNATFQALTDTIEKRRNGFSVYCTNEGDRYVQYGQSEHNRSEIEAFRTYQQAGLLSAAELHGVVGSHGVTRGRVKVVRTMSADVQFDFGDTVLVAGMTRPEYVPLMKQSVAIVTDEGGITCHAAIVSRELGIPCIIGTKIATQVLRDGDLVEVDAERGVVRVIERAYT
jgi:phosphohistidine swiveling domain-containing protein